MSKIYVSITRRSFLRRMALIGAVGVASTAVREACADDDFVRWSEWSATSDERIFWREGRYKEANPSAVYVVKNEGKQKLKVTYTTTYTTKKTGERKTKKMQSIISPGGTTGTMNPTPSARSIDDVTVTEVKEI